MHTQAKEATPEAPEAPAAEAPPLPQLPPPTTPQATETPQLPAPPETQALAAPEETKQLGYKVPEPFTPVSLPDGTIAMTQEQLDEYNQYKADVQKALTETYSADPLINSVMRKKRLDELGYVPPKSKEEMSQEELDHWNSLTKPEQEEIIQKAEAADKSRKKFTGYGGRWNKAELDQMGIEREEKNPPIDRSLHPDNIGIAGEPIANGGKPFASKEEATAAKKKSRLSDYVVAKTPDGYVLSPKTEEDIARGRASAANMLNSLGMQPGDIMGASQFIASQGGLSGNEKASMNVDPKDNPKHGATPLFRTNGMSIEKATQKLLEAGYISEDNHNLARDAINKNSYNYAGQQADAERKKADLEAEDRDRIERASLESPISEEMGYPIYRTYKDEALDLSKKAKEKGINVTEFRERAHEETYGQPEEAYYKRLADLLHPHVTGITDRAINRAENAFETTDEERKNARELEGKTLIEAAQWLVDKAPNRFCKIVANKILNRLKEYKKAGFILHFEVQSGEVRNSLLRNASGVTNTILGSGKDPNVIRVLLNGPTIRPNQQTNDPGTSYRVVLHELLHAATTAHIKFSHPNDPFVRELTNIYNIVARQVKKNRSEGKMSAIEKSFFDNRNNAFENPKELISWGMTDSNMQEFLSGIKYGDKSMFNVLTDLIRKIIGLSPNYDSALDALVRTTDSLLDERIEVLAAAARDQGYSFGEKFFSKPKTFQETNESVSGLKKAAEKATEKVAEKVHKAGQKRVKPTNAFRGMDPSLVESLDEVFYPENKTIVDKVKSLQNDFWEKLAQKTVDQFRSIKNFSPIGYMKARLSQSIDGALEGLLFYGHVFDDGGALNIQKNTKGLIESMKPLGDETDRFQIWMALNRESRLPSDKRSPNLAKLIGREDEFIDGKMQDGKSRRAVYESVQKDLNALNKSVLKVAYDKGLIDDEAYDRFSNDIFYIPFYRAMEETGDVDAIKTAATLTNQYFSKELKGKSEKPLGDLMENTLRNWSHILSAAQKNDAAVQTLKDAESMAAVSRAKPGQDTSNMVKVMINGERAYFDVHDPLLLESISNITFMNKNSPFLDIAKDFRNILRFGVTMSPAFKIGNLFKDSVQSMALSDLKKNPWANVAGTWSQTKRGQPAYIEALAGGGIFNFGTTLEGDQATLVKKLIERGVNPKTILTTPEGIKDGLKQLWQAYEDLGNRTEAVNRLALYNQLRKKGLSHLEASYQARDLLDFSMQGSSGAFRYLTQTVPFLNARLQGLYKLGRDGLIPTSRVIYNTATGKPIDADDAKKAQAFSLVTLSTMAASMLLYLAFKDDDEFKKREQWDRDNFWWIRLPGMDSALRIPKPFEIGAFGTIAERVLEQIVDKDVEGKVFGDSMSRMLTNTFSLNPIPQFIKPMVDIYANKDSFTGAPIETAGLERLSKQERMTDSTSPLAIALGGVSHAAANVLGEGSELSPMQIDYAIKSYLGWLGGTATAASHYAVMPFKDGSYPDANWQDRLSLGFVKSLPARQSSYMTSFYENNTAIQQAYADMRHYAELGQYDKVIEIQQEKGDLLALQKVYDKTSKELAKVRKQVRVITNDTDMDGTSKKEEIDRLTFLESELAQQAESIRKSMKD